MRTVTYTVSRRSCANHVFIASRPLPRFRHLPRRCRRQEQRPRRTHLWCRTADGWPQRLYLLAETAVTVAHADRDMVARFQDTVARLPTETLGACPAREDVGATDLLPLFDPATLTPALFLSLLAKCTTGKTRASLQEYADDEALLARLGGPESESAKPGHRRHTYDAAVFDCPDIEAFVSLTGLTVVLLPGIGWYGYRTFTGGTGELELRHHYGNMEWSAAFRWAK
jgi:hypothetical protein